MVTIERTFNASPEKLWAMWTTKEGLEKWYWPEALVTKVVRLDLRVGGGYEIAAPTLERTSRGTYTEIEPYKRLGIIAYVDFLQEAEPHERLDTIEFHAVPGGTRMVLTSTHLRPTRWKS
ncbi:SRPBCC domain-containing protein [Sorangium sp. So ce134]